MHDNLTSVFDDPPVVNVFLTIDTEAWPFAPGWPTEPLPPHKPELDGEIANYLYGTTHEGEYGVRYQMAKFAEYGLKGTYFVEALSADVLGRDSLRELIATIQSADQEVQLQLHTEWLGELRTPGLPNTFRQNMRDFSLQEQTRIIAYGLENLRSCGAERVVAIRAGNFGANLDTLRAAKANGLAFDSSHNVSFLDSACGLAPLGAPIVPMLAEGIVEVPVSYFCDYPNHFRNVQLSACSTTELKQALMWAWQNKWRSFVVVMHSFELLKNYDKTGKRITPHPMHVARFENLCKFLAANKDKFRTTHFRDYVPELEVDGTAPQWLRGRLHHTLFRYAEQVIGRF